MGADREHKHCKGRVEIVTYSPTMCLSFLNNLPAINAFTGCDITPSVFGLSKQTVDKTLKDSGLQSFGNIDKDEALV